MFDIEPVEIRDFYRAHDPRYIDGILAGSFSNGFGTRHPEVALSLFLTSGSLLSAARWALEHKQIACSPSSGFHHALHNSSSGFCTFNGLMLVAAKLKEEGLVQRVGILDLDQHYGNGTDDIIKHIAAKDWIFHYTAGLTFTCPRQVEIFFLLLPRILEGMEDCDLILYQAGADPHVNDPLGGWMTDEELAQRDHLVFQWAKAKNKALVWNLAGGYQKDGQGSINPVLQIHTQTALAHLKAI